MRQPLRASALLIVLFGAAVSNGAAAAQDRAGEPTISALPLPGGLAALRKAANDTGDTIAGQFFVDLVRRSFQTPVSVHGVRREIVMRPILDHLDRAAKSSPAQTVDGIPLPLTPDIWVHSLLEPGARKETLAADILRSASASLMYCGLLTLDDATRRWFGTHPELLAEIARRQPAHFLIAAPGLRIRDNGLQLPGGPAAATAWEAAVGKSRNDPAAFIKAVVLRDEVSLSYFIGRAAQLTPQQARVLFSLDGGEPARPATMKRLAEAFQRVASGWEVADKPFWRPTLDPAQLVADLRAADNGAPNLPGTAAFWRAAFSSDPIRQNDALAQLASGPPVEFSWLCEQIFNGGQTLVRPPYQLVLFASRRIPAVGPGNVRAALGAVRAAGQFPALAGTLERAHITELGVYDEAAQRARALLEMGDPAHAVLALAQFQGGVSMVARAATRGSLSSARAAALISTLSAISTDERGDYAGRIAQWVSDELLAGKDLETRAASVGETLGGQSDRDAQLLVLLSGPIAERGTTLEWEGSKYRVSFSSAEAIRLRHVLGTSFLPYITAAGTMVRAARAFEAGMPTRQALSTTADAVAAAAEAVHCTVKDEWESIALADRCREAVAPVARAARSGETKNAQRLAPRLRLLADALAARGLLVFAYAAALGQPDNAVISPLDAASRHSFGLDLPGFGRAGAWRWPAAGADRVRDWHLTGSLLGSDVVMSQYALVRISNRPPATRPSINDEDRTVLTESVVLMEPDLLTAEDHATIVRALKRGRERLAQLRGPADAEGLAERAQMPPLRRSIFTWAAGIDLASAAATLSISEIFAAGLDGNPLPARFDAWGVSAEPRLGCHCLQMPGFALEAYSGRWFSGVLATGFADMNLRVAELLDELHMPGALLAPVLASATWDFLMNVRITDFDDVTAWVTFASAIDLDRVEQYLALLTTDGPLVPFTEGSQP